MDGIRSVLVNDAVHSFCFAARQAPAEGANTVPWLNIMIGRNPFLVAKPLHMGYFDPRRLVPFAAYAFAASERQWAAMNNLLAMSDMLRRFTKAEQDYALELMERYYGCREQARSDINQFELFGNVQQGVPKASTISQRHKL